MPVIVFDSYDATGKTNYANDLADRLDYTIPKEFTSQLPEFSDPQKHKFWSQAQYFFLTRILSSGTKIKMIMDRWVMTEYCYSPVLRGYDIEDYYWGIEEALRNCQNFLWVYTTIDHPDYRTILKNRFMANGESYVTLDQTEEIKKRYDRLFEISRLPRIKINTSEYDPDTVSKNLDRILQALFEVQYLPINSTYAQLVRSPLGVTG